MERWLAEHGDVLWRFALARTRSRDAAEEVLQETVLAAMEGYAGRTGTSSERTWLLGIAAHKIADHFRSQRRRAGTPGAASIGGSSGKDVDVNAMFTARGMWATPPRAWGTAPDLTSEHAEILSTLRRCIDLLPPSLAEVVWLRDLLNIPADAVCKAMGLTPTNMWSRTHRARATLRLCIEKSIGTRKEGKT